MNREELKKMISLIEDDKLAEAATNPDTADSPDHASLQKTKYPTVRPIWHKTVAVAAAVILVITITFIWSKLSPALIPTQTTITRPVETTTGMTVVAPKWEELEVFEKYTGGAVINGIEYQSSIHELDENLIETKLGDFKLSGQDPYTDKTYEINAAFFRLIDIDPDAVVAVRYEGFNGYYGFFNSTYSFATLGDLINSLNLPKHLQINNIFQHSVWHGDVNKELLRYEYYKLPDPAVIWKQLLAQTDIVNEGEATRAKLGWEVMSISIDYPPAGQKNIGIVLFDNGYLTTNILWSLQSFYIGEDAVLAFKDYVLANGTLEKSIGLNSPVVTTVSESKMTTGESPVQTTQGTTKQ